MSILQNTAARAALGCASAALLATLGMGTVAFADEAPKGDLATEKVETVRIKTDPSGNTTDIIVKNELRNETGSTTLLDATDLSDIKPEDEGVSFTEEAGALVWQAEGENVSYSGNASDAAPISLKITYKLDGVIVTPEKLSGASGHLTVRYDYLFNDPESESLPFALITAVMVDGERFSNASVTNGKLITDDDKTIIVGYALPGMQSTLDVSKDDIEIPSYFEYEADVIDCAIGSSLTYASANLFDDFTREDLDISDLSDSAQALSDAMGEIIDVARQFSDGLKQLAKGATGLSGALAAIDKALPELVEGIGSLETLAQNLNGGLSAYASSVGGLHAGIKEITSGLEGAPEKISAAADGLREAAESLSPDSLNALTVALGAATSELESDSQAIEGIGSNIDSAISALDGLKEDSSLTAEQIAQIQAALDSLNAAKRSTLSSAATKQAADALSTMGGLAESVAELTSVADGLSELSTALDSAATGLKGIEEGLSRYADTEQGLPALAKLAGILSYGLSEASDGADELVDGISALSQGASSLATGAEQASDGSGKLVEGLQAYNDEGIGEVARVIQDDLQGIIDRFFVSTDKGRAFDNFSGKAEGTPSSVKFVFETEGIESSESD